MDNPETFGLSMFTGTVDSHKQFHGTLVGHPKYYTVDLQQAVYDSRETSRSKCPCSQQGAHLMTEELFEHFLSLLSEGEEYALSKGLERFAVMNERTEELAAVLLLDIPLMTSRLSIMQTPVMILGVR